MVDSMAAGVTEQLLVSFRRFMRIPRALVLLVPIWLLLVAATPTPTSPTPPAPSPSPLPAPSPSPSPPPLPTPVNAFLSLDVSAGDANTVINVTGGQFLPNQPVSLYWDQANHVAGSATADGNGSFNTRVKPFAGDAAGVHHLCASVQPNPCANFTLQAAQPSPSPTPSPSESSSPTPTAASTESPASSPVAATLNGFDVISRPPFVFLPIAGAAAIGLALAFWLFTVIRRPRQVAFPSAAVVHRAMRPDYSAGFGTPPSAAPAPAEPSAWPEGAAQPQPSPARPLPAQSQQQPPAEESQISSVEWGPPVEWGTGSSDWGFPEPPQEDPADAPGPRD
jgi:hypothetical protein